MVPFFVLTITLNILLSLAITYRLLSVRRMVTTFVGPDYGKVYTSLSAVIIESAALTSVTGIIALACYIQNGVLQHFVLEVYNQIIVSITLSFYLSLIAEGMAVSGTAAYRAEGRPRKIIRGEEQRRA